MEIPTYFSDFLAGIRPTRTQDDEARRAQKTLRERLESDQDLSPVVVTTFLQGSWRRATAVKPNNREKLDVDTVVVTRLSMDEYSPSEAMGVFIPFLKKHYSGKYRLQGRSFGIELSGINLDLVVTAAPSEADVGILQAKSVTEPVTPEDTLDWRLVKRWVPPKDRETALAIRQFELSKGESQWKLAPLYIPDREAGEWQPTHPLETMRWTWDKNRECEGHYVNVVKAIKWWRAEDTGVGVPPKGYPLEHTIGESCPDQIHSVAEGVTLSLEHIVSKFAGDAAQLSTPFLAAHGTPSQNVLARISGDEFADFYQRAEIAASLARHALDATDLKDSAAAWKELFGDRFPQPPADTDTQRGGYTPRTKETQIGGGRFA